MSDLPPTRKQLQCLICGRTLTTLGNLTHHRRVHHRSTLAFGASRNAVLRPSCVAGPAQQTGRASAAPLNPGAGQGAAAVPAAAQDDCRSRSAGDAGSGVDTRAESGSGKGGPRNDSDASGTDDLDPELASLLAATGELVQAAPSRKRRRRAMEEAATQLTAEDPAEACNPSLVTQVRAFSERFGDHKRLQPLVRHHKRVVTDEEEWLTMAYVPSVTTEKVPGGAERSKQRRIGVLQRVLYLALRDLINASHNGARFFNGDVKELLAVPCILLFICDQPEERSMLCLKPGPLTKPCSTCDAQLLSLSEPAALTALERTVLNTCHF